MATIEPVVTMPAAEGTCRNGPCSPLDRIMTTITNTTTTAVTIAPILTQRGVPGYLAAWPAPSLADGCSTGRAFTGGSCTTSFPDQRNLSRHSVYDTIYRVTRVVVAYPGVIPKLWQQTIQAHRREVRDAILNTAATLVAKHGLRAVTMSQIAEETGIGRATLYKYFSGVEPILIAWHERHVAEHLEQLSQLRDQPGDPASRLREVLRAYAMISFERHRHGAELATLVHHGEHMVGPEQQLVGIVQGLIEDAVELGAVRADVPTDELTTFCLHALEAGGRMPDRAAVERLVTVACDGLSPPARS